MGVALVPTSGLPKARNCKDNGEQDNFHEASSVCCAISILRGVFPSFSAQSREYSSCRESLFVLRESIFRICKLICLNVTPQVRSIGRRLQEIVLFSCIR